MCFVCSLLAFEGKKERKKKHRQIVNASRSFLFVTCILHRQGPHYLHCFSATEDSALSLSQNTFAKMCFGLGLTVVTGI